MSIITITSFFLIGLSGGFGHCVLMCHPFTLFISTKFSINKTGKKFIIPHLYYNLGRIITYSILGAIAGLLGSVIQFAGTFVQIQGLAAIIGGSLLIIYAILSLFKISTKSINIFKKIKVVNSIHPFITGLILGLLPCGLSMGAIIGAASSESAITGAIQTFAFGVGTSVAMITIAIFGSLALKYVKILSKISTILLLFMGVYFIYIGVTY